LSYPGERARASPTAYRERIWWWYGQITEEHIHAEGGEIILRRKIRRASSQDITFFKFAGVVA